MRVRAGRLARAALVAPLLVVLPACGGSDEPTATVAGSTTTTTAAVTGTSTGPGPTTTSVAPTTTVAPTVVSAIVRGGQVQGQSRQRVERNETVTVRVTSDVADDVHVHGYDKFFPVAAGATAEVTFVANIPGVFEVEFERSRKLLFTLEVRS